MHKSLYIDSCFNLEDFYQHVNNGLSKTYGYGIDTIDIKIIEILVVDHEGQFNSKLKLNSYTKRHYSTRFCL